MICPNNQLRHRNLLFDPYLLFFWSPVHFKSCDLSQNNMFFSSSLFSKTTKGSKAKVVSFAPDSIGYNGTGPEDSNHGNKKKIDGIFFQHTPFLFYFFRAWFLDSHALLIFFLSIASYKSFNNYVHLILPLKFRNVFSVFNSSKKRTKTST